MHEFTIALEIIEIASKYAKEAKAEKVNEIEIEIGSLAGVVVEALEFAMDSAVKNTLLENAKRKIIWINAIAQCCSCAYEFEIKNFYDTCPKCGQSNPEVLTGKELRVKSLNID